LAKKPRPSVIGYAEANFQKQPDHIRYLQQLPRCVETFVKMRNAVEHPGGHSGDLVIRNFRFEPDGALSAPDWRRDKDDRTEYGPVSIVDDMRVGVENLLILAEDILVIWAIDHAAFPGAMAVPVVNQIRTYWWCSPPRTGRQRMVPASLTARETGASFSKDKCVRTSL
jgi:hypothetical protein